MRILQFHLAWVEVQNPAHSLQTQSSEARREAPPKNVGGASGMTISSLKREMKKDLRRMAKVQCLTIPLRS